MEGACGYTEIHCIWSKSGYNEIQSCLNSVNLALDTIRYNVSGPSLDTMDTNLTSRATYGYTANSNNVLRRLSLFVAYYRVLPVTGRSSYPCMHVPERYILR